MDSQDIDNRVPAACTLPAAERPLRVAEFGDLFISAVREVTRPARTHARLVIDGSAEVTTRDLVARESACCSFFDFVITDAGADVFVLDVRVPPEHANVLDGLVAGATEALRRRSA